MVPIASIGVLILFHGASAVLLVLPLCFHGTSMVLLGYFRGVFVFLT